MQYLKEVKTLAKLNHPNIVQYKAAWIEPSLPSSFVSSMPSTEQRSHVSKCMKDLKSDNLQSDENSSNNTNKSNFNKARDSSRQDILFDDEESYTSTKLSSKQENKISDSASRHDTNIDRFHELNSLINIIGERITEKSITQESTEENSHIVSFRSSKSNETEGQAKYFNATNSDSHEESSNHRKVCTYISTSTSNGVRISNVH